MRGRTRNSYSLHPPPFLPSQQFAPAPLSIMAAIDPQFTLHSVTNHAVAHMGLEPTLDPQMLSNAPQRALPRKGSGVEGCFPCRWRKKKCKPVNRHAPSPTHPCSDCARFHIRCEGGGLERPAVSVFSFSKLITFISPSTASTRAKTLPRRFALT